MIYQSIWTILAIISVASAKVYFKEDFNDAGWKSRWTVSTEWKPKDQMGEWAWTAGKYFGDEDDKGIQTSTNARSYGISAPLSEEFTNLNKEIVFQFSVKNEQKPFDCGGAYIKLLGDMDQSSFGGETPYQIMFGPDMCGSQNRRTHVIFNYPAKNDNLLIKEDVKVETDDLTHLYTLVVRPDNTFEVFIDHESVRTGSLETAFDFLLPKEIPDPSQSKPADWVDKKMIADPEDKKPEGFDDIPREIADPDATRPDDWDDEEDGEWEAPSIPNPEYKGQWKPKQIPNPEYKGEWVHPTIANPDYKVDTELYLRANKAKYVGIELWQVTSGTLFDDIIVTDSLEEAKTHANATFDKKKGPEKEARDEAEKKDTPAPAEDDDEQVEDHDHDEL